MKFKRLLALLLAMAFVCSLCTVNVTAEETDVSMFTYSEGANGIVIEYCEDMEGTITVPSQIDGLDVVEVYEMAFMYNSAEELPDTIEIIGASAFQDCVNLAAVNIPDSVTEIGNYAFSGCESLAEITIPETVKLIGTGAFSGCADGFVIKGYTGSPAETYASENSISFESIGESQITTVAEGECGDALVWVLDKDGTLTISGTGAMEEWSYSGAVAWYKYLADIKKVVVEEGVTSISPYAFRNCVNLAEVSWAYGITAIGDLAFANCTALGAITVPDSVTELGDSVFSGCTALTAATLPDGITAIPDSTFYEATSLKSFVVPDTVTTIENWAFRSSGLTEITIPYKTTSISAYAFNGCSEKLVIKGYTGSEAESWAADNGYTFTSIGDIPLETVGSGYCGGYSNKEDVTWTLDTYGRLVISGTGEMSSSWYNAQYVPWYGMIVKSVEIGEGITSLGGYALYGQKRLTSVTLPKTMKVIGNQAFSGCTALTNITIPNSVFDIGNYAFDSCTGLTEVTIPETVVALDPGYPAFYRCSGELVIKGYTGSVAEYYAKTTGKTFESIGTASGNVAVSGTHSSGVAWSVTTDGRLIISGNATLPDNQWSNTYPWDNYISCIREIVIEKGVAGVGTKVFSDLDRLEKITFPEMIVSVDSNAFVDADFANLTVYGYTGSAAESYAEAVGAKFESLGVMSDGPVSSGTCGDSLTWALSKEGTLTISGSGMMYNYGSSWYDGGEYAPWHNYESLIKSAVIENGVNSIGNQAFYELDNLTDIYIPYTVVSIDHGAVWVGSTTPTVHGYNSTAAQTYASQRGLGFESLGDVPADAYFTIASGTYGDNLTWTLDSNGLLTISGTGEMQYASYAGGYPWHNYMEYVKSLKIEEGITSITEDAFYEYSNLTDISFASTITYIGSDAFGNCDGITELELPPAEKIESGAFWSCDGLTSVVIPDGVKTLGGAFQSCSKLKEATVSYTVTSIGSYEFWGCVTPFTIKGYSGSAAQTFVNNKYSSDYVFVSIGVKPIEPVSGTWGALKWDISSTGVLTISGSGEMDSASYYQYPWYSYKKNIYKVVIGEGVLSVSYDAFWSYSELTEVVLSDTVYALNSAFGSCSALTTITIPETVTSINDEFYGCDKLVIKGYTNSAAYRYAMKNDIPFVSLGVMEYKVLETGKCGDNLTWSYDNYAVLTISGSGAMYDYDLDENTVPWADCNVEKLVLDSKITHIGSYAFYEMSDVTELTLPSSLKSVGDYAFYRWWSIRKLTIPQSVETVGANAFLIEGALIIPGDIEAIGENGLGTGVIFGNEDSNVEAYATEYAIFYPIKASGQCGESAYWNFDITTGALNITGSGDMYDYYDSWYSTSAENQVQDNAPWAEISYYATELNISDNITKIGDLCFTGMSIDKLVLPSSLKEIGEYAFAYNEFVGMIEIPDGCTTIQGYAFNYAGEIDGFIVPESVTDIGSYAFRSTYENDAVIYGMLGSTAETYAASCSMTFIALDGRIDSVNVYLSGNYLNVSIYGEGLDGRTLYVAGYDKDGALLETAEAGAGAASSAYSASLSCTDAYSVKVFCWGDDMKPICGAVSKNVQTGSGSGGSGSSGGSSAVGGTETGGVVVEGGTVDAG